jgi:hypothetical protein
MNVLPINGIDGQSTDGEIALGSSLIPDTVKMRGQFSGPGVYKK